MTSKIDILRNSTFGQRVAEDETDLKSYFVETDDWNRLIRGDIDVIYGAKGAGKSALYALLLSETETLFNSNVLLIPGENPRGAPAFRDLANDPPTTEREFVAIWKLYFCTLLYSELQEYSIENSASKALGKALAQEGLVKGSLSLAGILKGVVTYVRRLANPQAIEAGMDLDPLTGTPNGFKGKITLSEPERGGASGELSVDELLKYANDAFAESKLTTWILLDRLDVAFAENTELEINALRALFRVYLDLQAHPSLKMKIFLRTDIWARITEDGFREASHITRHITINWSHPSLLNLIIRRAINNPPISTMYGVDHSFSRALAKEQESFFYRMFPSQIDVGEKKPTTFDWLLTRTRDGSKLNAPRELIHFLNSLGAAQIKAMELGEPEPEGEKLFGSLSFKEALPEVSKVRLEQTLYAEHPDKKRWIEMLRKEKTGQRLSTLAEIWNISHSETSNLALELANIGFFEVRGSKSDPEFWIPFLYRDALELIQGNAEN